MPANRARMPQEPREVGPVGWYGLGSDRGRTGRFLRTAGRKAGGRVASLTGNLPAALLVVLTLAGAVLVLAGLDSEP